MNCDSSRICDALSFYKVTPSNKKSKIVDQSLTEG